MALEDDRAAVSQELGYFHAFFVALNRLDMGIDRQRVADQLNPFLAHGPQGNAQDA